MGVGVQDTFVLYSLRHFLQHDMMSHRIEVGPQVQVDDVGLALCDCSRGLIPVRQTVENE
jgi:hypothetical protein